MKDINKVKNKKKKEKRNSYKMLIFFYYTYNNYILDIISDVLDVLDPPIAA